MFKTGDKVVAVDDVYYSGLVAGDTYTISVVKEHKPIGGEKPDFGPYYLLKEKPENTLGFFGFRFKPATPEFDRHQHEDDIVSTATDQELADEYHRLTKECDQLRRTLHDRGYKLFVSFENEAAQRQVTRFVDYRVFRKSVTQTIEL